MTKFDKPRKVLVHRYAFSEEEKRWMPVPDFRGVAHGFGVNYEEGENGFGNYTAVIVEAGNGQVYLPAATLVQFLEPESPGIDIEIVCSCGRPLETILTPGKPVEVVPCGHCLLKKSILTAPPGE